jgi:glycosyltransferase involved in cell wall biosynthesis
MMKGVEVSETNPRVTVLMSVYNGEEYLREAVDSILNQSFRDFEFLIINDGSTDSTKGIIESYDDPRIQLIDNGENIGLTRSLNRGLRLSRGEYIVRQDHDDVSMPERLERQVEFLDRHPEAVVVASNFQIINSENILIKVDYRRARDTALIAWRLLFYNCLAGHSQVMFRRKNILDLGGYSEEYAFSQDHNLWLRINEVGRISSIPDVLIKKREHEDSITSRFKEIQEENSLKQSQHALSKLIGKEISVQEVNDLRIFWKASEIKEVMNVWTEHARRINPGVLHNRLKEIYRAFIEKQGEQNLLKPGTEKKIRDEIGKQFLFCAKRINMFQMPLLKLRYSLYAFPWTPLRALCFWPKAVWNALKHLI